ncbi:hypothetical protein [Blastopirellula marina]|uniref:Uncharacterized protein n=1 Tax=Blastopirellula marina TaxID=124 RepID=A0A2S8G9L2_9BACT|nr:hypothetical protein [Blastopirellula marina]PQO41123.1 hypothetical protein C5Y98_03970 [Blastopirellula marina]PTL45999.1 hypothetical protein C5Y97_03970 [Blastopirellula marina]
MAYEQVRTIVHDLARKHLAASEACRGQVGIAEPTSRVRLLLDHFEAFEVDVYSKLELDHESIPNEILEAWIQYVPMEPVDAALRELENAEPDNKPRQLLEFHETVTQMLETISAQVSSEKISEFFQSLTELEQSFSRQCAVAQSREDEI